MKVNPIVLVGIPTLQDAPISWEWHDASKSMQFPLGTAVSHIRVVEKIIADARNIIAKQAIAMNADKVLFISDDVIPPPRIFEMLNRHQKELVTGIYWTKETNPKPYIWRGQMQGPYEDWKFGEFFEIDWAGVDALLIDTKVFRKIPYPWFSHNWTWSENLKFSLATEDQYFYAKAKEYGYKLYCDSSVQCGHQDRKTKRIFGLTEEMLQVQDRKKSDKKSKIAVIGDDYINDLSAEITFISDNENKYPDLLCDYRVIPDESNKYDMVTSSVLDKFKIEDAASLITEWHRIVKVGGSLEISVTNATKAALEILKADANENFETGIHDLLYEKGKQVSFTKFGLKRTINDAGFDCEITEKDDNIIATIIKIEKSEIFNITNTFEKFIREDVNTLEKKVNHAIALGAMQKPLELMEMAKLIEEKKPRTIVEIGTANGETFSLLCQICPEDSILVSIDLPGGDFSGGYSESDVLRLKAFAKGNQQVHCILNDSHLEDTKKDLLKIIKKIDILIIDGDHSYEGVKKDFEMYSPLMSNGGLIFFHDIRFHPFNHGCEVNLFWRKLKEKYEVQEFIDTDDINWGGIGMIKWEKTNKR